MQPAETLAQLAADGRALGNAATDLEAPVPPCPGWNVKDAVEHTAMVYAHKSQLHRLIENLRTRDPSAHAGNWYEPDQTVGFWVRRKMQETVVHRADVESAFGSPSRVNDVVAIDGVDELIECFLSFDTWAPEKPTFERTTAGDADATVSGDASDLLLALWNRLSYDALRTEGDPAALAALFIALAACTQ